MEPPASVPPPADLPPLPTVTELALLTAVATHTARFEPLAARLREARLLTDPPWTRTLGSLTPAVTTVGWKFPTPAEPGPTPALPQAPGAAPAPAQAPALDAAAVAAAFFPPAPRTLLKPAADTVLFKDRLLYLLQPPLEDLFGAGRTVQLPFRPYPYQVQGIAFLMPRHNALIADEMGLGKTAQVIIALRLLLHAGLIGRALVVCPKPLVVNWTRELRLWAPDVPFEVISGDAATRRFLWLESRCPVKLVNYEVLTRDAAYLQDDRVRFDVAALDEAQRIKNRESKTAQVVHTIRRERSWAMSGTPIENRVDDLVNIFEFVDPGRVPPGTPARHIPKLVEDCVIRRTKEDAAADMPPRVIRDLHVELTPAQRAAYELAEKDGVIHLNELGQTLTVQHVFELVMRLKQICNFDPRTGESAKLERLQADLTEVAASGRKAIVFSQYVEPLERLAAVLADYGPVQYHGRIPHALRQANLDEFKRDPAKRVILMSYATGSVGLNLQFTNYVFLFDRWWNPAIEDQAINRAHRLGQQSTVFVTRFISPGTIEGRIAEVLEKKRQLFQEVVAQNGRPTLGLSEEEIFGLFDIQARPKRAA